MKNWLQSNRGFLVFLLCFGVFRTAIADWNPIPSGSMWPTIQEGDVVLVNRVAYSVKVPLTDVVLTRTGEPQRGDVVTFTSPLDGTRLIKRVVGVPGDVVRLDHEVLTVNGEAASYSNAVQVQEPVNGQHLLQATRQTETLAGHSRRIQTLNGVQARSSFDAVTVPPDSYLVLGDNRDNSADSRYVGFVPRHLLIGRAHRVLVSADMLGNWLPVPERFGLAL